MAQPSITSTTHTLPFDKLSARDFEWLCLWLVEREGYKRAEHLGAVGSEQGRDVVAWREGEVWPFQRKRVRYRVFQEGWRPVAEPAGEYQFPPPSEADDG